MPCDQHTATYPRTSRSILPAWTLAGLLIAAGAGPTGIAAQTPERTPLPPGQVWQCVRDGHKTFSDAPCGAGATIRQLNDINVMDPAPAAHGPPYPASHSTYVPNMPYPASYRGDGPPSGIEGAADASNAEDPVYVSQQVGILNSWQRARHPPRPLHHDHPSSRAHAGHAAGR